MARTCSLCGHPHRAEIDAALSEGAPLDTVVARFDLPSRSALQRHRAGHLGRTVTFHLPPAAPQVAPPPPSPPATPPLPETDVSPAPAPVVAPPAPPAGAIDASARLDELFARALSGPDRTLQDHVRLVLYGLTSVYAAADMAGDRSVAVRALRELRALLQFHALVPVDKLRGHAGWQEPPAPVDPLHYLEAWLTAPLANDPGSAEAAALGSIGTWRPELAAALGETGHASSADEPLSVGVCRSGRP